MAFGGAGHRSDSASSQAHTHDHNKETIMRTLLLPATIAIIGAAQAPMPTRPQLHTVATTRPQETSRMD